MKKKYGSMSGISLRLINTIGIIIFSVFSLSIKADKALYKVKNSGRSGVFFYD